MNLLEFSSKVSSTNSTDKIADNFEYSNTIFNLLSSNFENEDIKQIDLNKDECNVVFANKQTAVFAEGRFSNRIIPGVYNRPVCQLSVLREDNSLRIKFLDP